MTVFVYGSLLREEQNHAWLEGAEFLREAKTRPVFTLFDLGSFPGLVEGGETAVWGEVYEVGPPVLADLDRLEGHPRFFRRVTITLADGGEAEAYLLPPGNPSERSVILSGNWRERAR